MSLTRSLANAFIAMTLASAAQPVIAVPEAAAGFCSVYPDFEKCSLTQKTAPCFLCHSAAPELNAYGKDLQSAARAKGVSKTDLASELANLLNSIEDKDSDGDSIKNADEIAAGSLPGDKASRPVESESKVYDAAKALNRIYTLYCGMRPTYAVQQNLKNSKDQKAFLHGELDKCLASTYWRDQGLRKLADDRIRPVKALGLKGDVVLADYEWDYRLFVYALSANRDARDLLLADYHIDDKFQKVTGVIKRQLPFTANGPGGGKGPAIVLGTGQPLVPERRAGMITTQWFLMMNTMFATIPRTAAAQAYRSYLGLDIAKSEGLIPIQNEPRDVDNKNVKPQVCAVCHSTLDPLSYSFASYNGIEVNAGGIFQNTSGAYNANRTPYGGDGFLFGEPVADLREWAQKAANSDEFKRNLALMFFKDAFGREPNSGEREAFAQVWGKLGDDGYSANKLIHRLIDLAAFGGVNE